MKMKNSKIQSDAKAGMKRKIELVNSNPNDSKTPLKADLVIQLKQLQDDFNALEASNKKNLEKIKCLQEKIKTMESEKQTSPKETQTEHGLELKCDECNFEATNQLELSWHMERSMDGHKTRMLMTWTLLEDLGIAQDVSIKLKINMIWMGINGQSMKMMRMATLIASFAMRNLPV